MFQARSLMSETQSDLRKQHCQPCKPGTPALNSSQVASLLKSLDGWALGDGAISREFKFKNFYETIAFVNAIAWIANREDHHPDMEVGYNKCLVKYSTHSVGGLSQNDFICAAKVDQLLES
jgi:4a-hydroxytetrahydrobiopterin dehydratase